VKRTFDGKVPGSKQKQKEISHNTHAKAEPVDVIEFT
jgi:hypothetical protein